MKRIIFSFLTCLCLTSCQKTEESSNPKGAGPFLIAYNIFKRDSVNKDDWEVMVLDPETGESKNLTNHPDVAWTYLAHENKIYFISDRDTAYRNFFLYEMNSDGSNVKKLSALRLEDSWMDLDPETNEMVVSGRLSPEIRYQLFLINLKDGKHRQLTSDTSIRFQDPVFSPDGKIIAFVKSPKQKIESVFPEIYRMDRNGGEMKQLTKFPVDDPAAKGYGYKAGALRWHPTENFISYATTRGSVSSIFGVNPDGSKTWKISLTDKDEVYHDWSPDGKWLTFDQYQDTVSKQYHLVLMNWETKESRILTDTLHRTQLAPAILMKQ